MHRSLIAVSLLVVVVLCVQPMKGEQGENGTQQNSPGAASGGWSRRTIFEG